MPDAFEKALRDSGEPFDIERGSEITRRMGLRNTKKNTISFRPGTVVRTGDRLVQVAAGREYYVIEVEPVNEEGRPVMVRAYYKTGENTKSKLQRDASREAVEEEEKGGGALRSGRPNGEPTPDEDADDDE